MAYVPKVKAAVARAVVLIRRQMEAAVVAAVPLISLLTPVIASRFLSESSLRFSQHRQFVMHI
jgi:hypothetical protein